MMRLPRLVMLATIAAAAACIPDSPTVKIPPPPLPPAMSLEVDLSFFYDRTPAPDGPTSHWNAALERVPLLDSVVVRHLEGPAAVYAAAVREDPREDGSGWRWPIDVVTGGQRYTGYLRSGKSGIQNSWVLAVSAPNAVPPLDDYVWVVGTSDAVAANGGTWVIGDYRHASSTAVASVHWSRRPNATSSIDLEVYEASQPNPYTIRRSGDSWEVRYDRDVDVEKRFVLVWNPVSGKGIINVGLGGNQCWDANLHDSPCQGLSLRVGARDVSPP